MVTVLWISKQPGSGGGDEIYDKKMIASLKENEVPIKVVTPVRVSRLRELINLLMCIPHYRSWYASLQNRQMILEGEEHSSVAVYSWEPFDYLAVSSRIPAVVIAHNVTSLAVSKIFQNSVIVRWWSRWMSRWEIRSYRAGNIVAIGVLSRADKVYLEKTIPQKRILYLPPGMPPVVVLKRGAIVKAELVVSGSYSWKPKARDLKKFCDECKSSGNAMRLIVEEDAAVVGQFDRLVDGEVVEYSDAIRFGVITDRFVAGHKLKATSYIAKNCIVVTYADIRSEFENVPDGELFVRYVKSIAEISEVVRQIIAMPCDEVCLRFDRFKKACAEQFSWRQSAHTLLQGLIGE